MLCHPERSEAESKDLRSLSDALTQCDDAGSIRRLVLLPGMDGTGELYANFIAALPHRFEMEIVRYPVDVSLSYSELLCFVQSTIKDSEPFVLIAESFSTPLTIQLATTNPPNLKGLVLC